MLREVIALLLMLAPLWPDGAPPPRADDFGRGHDALVLEESLELDIRSITDARVRYLRRVQVLTGRGVEEFHSDSVDYGPSTVVDSIQGTVILPSGKRLRTSNKDVLDAPDIASFELYSSNRRQHLSFPGVVPGAIVEFSYEKIVHNLFYLDHLFLFQDETPALLRTLTVREPAGVPMWLSATGGVADYTREQKDGVTIHRWRAQKIQSFREEPDGPPALDMLPSVTIKPQVFDWIGYRVDASTWDGIAKFYREIAEGRMQPPPEVAQAAAQVVAGAGDAAGMTRKVYEFLQDKVDYVAIELGIGGWQPHPSGQVLRYKYGDCKDKATLMIAMLRSLDLRALPVLIRTRDSGLVAPEHPSLSFNHAIVAIPSDDGYLFIDPTSTVTPFGDLPWADQGANALVVEQDGRGVFLTTPVMPAARNERHISITGSIDASGALHAKLSLEARGQRLNALAALRDASGAERQERMADLMGDLVPGAQMETHEIDGAAVREGVMRVSFGFTVPRYVTSAGALEVVGTQIVRFPDLTSMASASERSQPIFFHYPLTEIVDTELQLPLGMTLRRLPQDRKFEQAGFATETRYALAPENGRNTLRVNRSITISRREVPSADYAALRAFVSSVADEDARAVTLQPE